jgi:hypothetical protein
VLAPLRSRRIVATAGGENGERENSPGEKRRLSVSINIEKMVFFKKMFILEKNDVFFAGK